ncbi:MAG: ABC-2 type transport system permease protein [Chlamydiales bacterium]|jgi:ABC-2 type transport system permease protein
MKRTLAVLARELRSLFESPIAYVTIVLFIITQSALFFFAGYPVGKVPLPGLWEGGQASLIVLFTWLPLLFAFLVPALAMGAWAEERGAGTEELLLTYPVRTREVVLGKFLAVWGFVSLLVVLTVLPVAWTVDGLGDLDWSTVWVGMAGAILLAAGYSAIALPFSAATGEQLVAFLLGAITLGLLWAARFAVDLFPSGFAHVLEYAAPSSHFLQSAARGVFDLRDVVYFGLLVLFGLNLNVLLVERRRWA